MFCRCMKTIIHSAWTQMINTVREEKRYSGYTVYLVFLSIKNRRMQTHEAYTHTYLHSSKYFIVLKHVRYHWLIFCIPGLASYLQTQNQKPEWKRYKQYTRNDIMAAIEAVRGGMSALQAARKFGVPSRTLYDKVKKLGITTNRPYRKGSFPMSPYQGNNVKMDESLGYSPEEQPLDISNPGFPRNGNGNLSLHGQEGDSDKMDSDPGSSIKQEHEQSLPLDDIDDPHYHGSEENPENGSSEICSTPSPPRARQPSEKEEDSGSGIMSGAQRLLKDDSNIMAGQRLVMEEAGIIAGQRLIKEDDSGIIVGQRLIKEET